MLCVVLRFLRYGKRLGMVYAQSRWLKVGVKNVRGFKPCSDIRTRRFLVGASPYPLGRRGTSSVLPGNAF